LNVFTPQWAPNASKWSWIKSQVMFTVILYQKNFILPKRTRKNCCLDPQIPQCAQVPMSSTPVLTLKPVKDIERLYNNFFNKIGWKRLKVGGKGKSNDNMFKISKNVQKFVLELIKSHLRVTFWWHLLNTASKFSIDDNRSWKYQKAIEWVSNSN
jgi:hypothetical protein